MDRSKKCKGKARLSKKDAQYKSNEYSRSTGDYMRYYHCPYCNYWHIGHSNERKPSYRKTKGKTYKQFKQLSKIRKQLNRARNS